MPGGGHNCNRMEGEIRNYWAAGWYGNLNNYATNGWENPMLAANWSISQSEQEVMSLADPFVRELYFANDLTYIYIGFEETESFRTYPLDDSRYLVTWDGYCVRDIPISDWSSKDLFHRIGYTPLCRGWYELARRLDGEVAYNGIDISASTGLLYLALSVAVKDFTGKFFGVAAVEASLNELQDVLSEKILVSGYFFLGDLDGSLIIHPQLEQTEEANIKDVEFECDGSFFKEKWNNIIASKSGMYEHKKCGETYLIYWQLVKGTEYISFLTVPLSETEIPAEKVREQVSKTIEVMVGLCVGLSLPLGVGILFLVSWMMSSSLKNLVRAVNEIAVSPENYIVLPKSRFFHSSELVMILTNMKRLLASLRFANPEYNKSDLDLELANILELEDVMRKLNNQNGLGVVENNHANVLRQLAKSRKDEASHLLSLAETYYKAAIEKASIVSSINDVDSPVSSNPAIQMTNLNSGSTNTKVLSRMLGLALVHMDQILLETGHDRLNQTIDIFEKVLKIYYEKENWKGLATQGYLIATHELCGKSPALFHELIKNSNLKSLTCLQRYLKFSGKLIPSDYSDICKLCYNIWWIRGEINYILWPLLNVPRIPKNLLYIFAHSVFKEKSNQVSTFENVQAVGETCLATEGEGETYGPGEPVASAPSLRVDTFEKQDETEGTISSSGPSRKRIQKVIDLHMSRQFTVSWKDRLSASKAILFVLDASGSMAGSRLRICKDSIRNILENYISDDDHVGFIAFASHTMVLFEMIPKKGKLQFMLERIEQLEVFGQTSFYDAMLEAVQKLSAVVGTNKWIIALTDGEDTGSKVDPRGYQATKIIQEQRLNLACITVGKLPDKFMKIIENYISSAKSGMHVGASNTKKIADAFQKIAHLIDGGLNECL